jgi:NADH dehydrogenase
MPGVLEPREDGRPHVVIIGGGFAGLYAARNLGDPRIRVTVVDRRNHHLFQPMLYQVATAALSAGDIASPIRSVLSRHRNTEVILAEVVAVHPDRRTLDLGDGSSIKYDYLICAPGARHSYFGKDQWEYLAPGLKNLEDALEVRRRVLLAFERAERERDPVRRQGYLTFVVVGGGPTGVEMAGALAELRRYALRKDFRHIDSREAVVMLLEGGTRLLTSYPPSLSDRTKDVLRRLGVEVRLETLVTDIQPGYVVAAGWTIPTHTVIWAAGNVASPLLKTLGAPLDRQGRVLVEPDCSVPGHPEILVLGDAAAYHVQGGHRGSGVSPEGLLPGTAPVAIQMGEYAARTIKNDLRGRPRTGFQFKEGRAGAGGDGGSDGSKPAGNRHPFQYWNKGQLAVIGRGRAVADIGRLHFSGFVAWLIWIFVHIFFLIGFRNRVIVLFEWAYSYVTFKRGARLIQGEVHAPVPTEPIQTP